MNPKIVKALIKVIIDDTEYEIYNLGLYLDYLKGEAHRLEKIMDYEKTMNKATKDTDKAYYLAGMKELFASGETVENYKQVLEDYKSAYVQRQESMNSLTEELKKIKKLKV